ncbi:MAG: acyl-CoA desaturase [Myxococcales bacterium]|nr:acyl-CoA desaturase [Myxococcales bacterium]
MMQPRPQAPKRAGPRPSHATQGCRTSEAVPPSKFTFVADTTFQLEVRRRVAQYFDRGGISTRDQPSMYIKSAVLVLWFVGSYAALIFAASEWWQVALLSCSLAFAAAGIAFSIQHDANHGAYSTRRRVNHLAGMSLDLLGASSYIWKWKHNVAHHTYTGLHGCDSDIEVPFGRLNPAQRHRPHHRFQHYYLWAVYALFVAHWHLFEDFKQLIDGRISQHPFPRPRGRQLLGMIAGKLLFFSWAFAIPMIFHPWWAVLLGYIAISALLSIILVLVFQLAHTVAEAALPTLGVEDSQVPRPWAVHQVEATADFAPRNRALTWYLGGLNYQIEHHLFPRVSHIHYPSIARIVEEVCAELGVRYTVHTSMWRALWSHGQWLVQMGKTRQSPATAA